MITKAYWDSLSDKARWDTFVALRGPDTNYGEVLKWFTTSVIRGQVREVFRVGGLVNHDLQLVVLPQEGVPSGRRSRAEWNWQHFASHVATAADWLEVPKLRVETQVWHAAMQESSSVAAIKAIQEAAEVWRVKDPERAYSKLYKPLHLKELERHARSGQLYV